MVTELKRLDTETTAPGLVRDEVIQVYEEVFGGRRRRFPNNFFHGDEGRARAAIITRYLLEEKLGIAVHDHVVIAKSGQSSFKSLGLL